jgi:NADH-quinone oxidoreductase subunit J
MTNALFYILAAVAVVCTTLCITEKHPVHAIIWLVTSFFSLAVIFYLLAAPLVAVFEVIIYAGAIMVLFLFIIMMIGEEGKATHPSLREWWPALIPAVLLLVAAGSQAVGTRRATLAAVGDVSAFARLLFGRYGVAVEIVSLQLLFALVGALYLARREK